MTLMGCLFGVKSSSMSDLPSRARVADLGCTASSPKQAEDIEAILNAYRVGRLVDREAIDWETLIVEATSTEAIVKLLDIAAAIGDTE